MSLALNKPPSWGLFHFCSLGLLCAFWWLNLPGLYRPTYTSPEFFLVFLTVLLMAVAWGARFPLPPVRFGLPTIGLLLAAGWAALLASSAPPAMALVIVYIALFLLCQAVLPSRVILFALALAGLGYALAGLSDVVNVQLGLVDQLSSLYPGRLVGRFAQPNLLGCFMVVAMVSLVQLLNDEAPRKSNRLVAIPLTLMAWALLLTASRAAMLGLLVGAGVTAMVYFRTCGVRQGIRPFSPLIISLVLAYALISAGASLPYTPPGARVGGAKVEAAGSSSESFLEYRNREMTSGQLDHAAYMRFNYWMTGLLVGLDHPWGGAGPGSYKKLLSNYTIRAAEDLSLTYNSFATTYWPHNDYLHHLAEFGFPAAILAVLALSLFILRQLRDLSRNNLFLLVGVIAFAVAMCFGHPFRHHLTAMAFIMLLAVLCARQQKGHLVPVRLVAMLLGPWVVVAVCLLVLQIWHNHLLHQGLTELVQTKIMTPERLVEAHQNYLSKGYGNNLYAWEFQDRLYSNLYAPAITAEDNRLAETVVPLLSAYRQENSFYTLAFAEAQLRYKLRDYEAAGRFSYEAFQKKPDRDEFFDIYHMVNVLRISAQEKRPVIDLVGGPEVFDMLKNVGYLKDDQLDSGGIALPGRPFIPSAP